MFFFFLGENEIFKYQHKKLSIQIHFSFISKTILQPFKNIT